MFAKIDEEERVPAFGEFGFVDAAGEFGEARVIADALKPIRGVRVIRLATMDDGVDVTAVRCFDVLNDSVRRIEVVVPDEHGSAKEFGGADSLQLVVQRFLRGDLLPRAWAQFGR